MDLTTYRNISTKVADVIATDGYPATRVEMGEMADGSCRHFALVTTYDKVNDQEQQYRVATWAPAEAPAWARERYRWTSIEVRIGGGWMLLEPEEV